MNTWRLKLEEIGHDLDNHIFPVVTNGGFVQPGESAAIQFSGTEIDDVTSRFKRRSSTGSWQRTERRQGPAYAAPPLVHTGSAETYEADLTDLEQAYPGAQIWRQPDGFWIVAKSGILDGLGRPATFVTGMSLSVPGAYQSWAFWEEYEWIGPRHTNFPDGSICAFDPVDNTWLPGESLVSLFDLYTVWTLRHLHLSVFGRWPGSQAVPDPFERILELQEDELCGCDNEPPKSYGACCMDADLRRNRVADAVHFIVYNCGGVRTPPDSVRQFVAMKKKPPPLQDVFMIRA